MNDLQPIQPKTISIDLWKAVAILVTAVIGSAGAGLWSGLTTLNADHYQLTALAQKVSDHERTSSEITKDLQKWIMSVDNRLSKIEGRLGVKSE